MNPSNTSIPGTRINRRRQRRQSVDRRQKTIHNNPLLLSRPLETYCNGSWTYSQGILPVRIAPQAMLVLLSILLSLHPTQLVLLRHKSRAITIRTETIVVTHNNHHQMRTANSTVLLPIVLSELTNRWTNDHNNIKTSLHCHKRRSRMKVLARWVYENWNYNTNTGIINQSPRTTENQTGWNVLFRCSHYSPECGSSFVGIRKERISVCPVQCYFVDLVHVGGPGSSTSFNLTATPPFSAILN